MAERTRLTPDQRRVDILTCAAEMAQTMGYRSVTRKDVAHRAGVATGLISYYFEDMIGFRDALYRHALEHEILPILAQGITAGDPIAREIEPDLFTAAFETLRPSA